MLRLRARAPEQRALQAPDAAIARQALPALVAFDAVEPLGALERCEAAVEVGLAHGLLGIAAGDERQDEQRGEEVFQLEPRRWRIDRVYR